MTRDLQIATTNITAARAQVRIQQASQLPEVVAGAGATITDSSGQTSGGFSGTRRSLSADIGITSFELDLFGRLAALTRAEQQRYLAAAARAIRLTLVGDIRTRG